METDRTPAKFSAAAEVETKSASAAAGQRIGSGSAWENQPLASTIISQRAPGPVAFDVTAVCYT